MKNAPPSGHRFRRTSRLHQGLLVAQTPLPTTGPYGTYDSPVEAEYARSGYRPLRSPAEAE